MTTQELAHKCIEEIYPSDKSEGILAKHTGRLYKRGIEKFVQFCGEEITPEDFIKYPSYLTLEYHSKKTASAYLSGAAYFRTWLVEQSVITFSDTDATRYKNAIKRAFGKHQKTMPNIPPKGAAELMKEAVLRQQIYSPIKERDIAIIYTFASSGIRREELQSLSVEDVDLEKCTLRINHGKGDKERVAFVSAEAAMAIRNYWKAREWEYDVDDPAFARHDKHISKNHAYMTSQAVYSTVIRIARLAGIHFTPHQFRHDVATKAVATMGVSAAQKTLGHEQSSTTLGYVDIHQEDLQEAYKKAFG